jgi:hypothetical protein
VEIDVVVRGDQEAARVHQRGKGVPRRAVVGATRRDRVLLVERLKALLLEDL